MPNFSDPLRQPQEGNSTPSQEELMRSLEEGVADMQREMGNMHAALAPDDDKPDRATQRTTDGIAVIMLFLLVLVHSLQEAPGDQTESDSWRPLPPGTPPSCSPLKK